MSPKGNPFDGVNASFKQKSTPKLILESIHGPFKLIDVVLIKLIMKRYLFGFD